MDRQALMTLTAGSTLPEVALAVGAGLRSHGIQAVLTGGACVSVYTNGMYVSKDADFVIQSAPARLQQQLDEALGVLGFTRRNDRYVHDLVPFWVEFPPGPLSIGNDLAIHPIELRVGDSAAFALSPTDSCRDRLAAFYFWDDRQSLSLAVAITRHQLIDFEFVRQWSTTEGCLATYEEFVREVEREVAPGESRNAPARPMIISDNRG
jgi:hypothetical protein